MRKKNYVSYISLQNEEIVSKQFRKQLFKYGEIFIPHTKEKFNFTEDMADEMIESFSLGVIEKIPLLLGTHDDGAMERTVGVVNGLEKDDDGLYFTTEITDDDTLEKLNTTTEDGVRLYSGVSAKFGALNNEDGEERYAVIHVALTHKPVITGLKDFVALSMAIGNEDAMYNFEISLSDLERKVRRAFYDQVRDGEDYDYYYDIWIADVFDNYVICEKGDGTYSKYHNNNPSYSP